MFQELHMFREPAQEFDPGVARHPLRVLGRQSLEAAVLEGDACSGARRLEADLNLGWHRRQALVAVYECHSNSRLPGDDAPHLVALACLVPDLNQPAADAGLEADADRALGVVPAVGAGAVPD